MIDINKLIEDEIKQRVSLLENSLVSVSNERDELYAKLNTALTERDTATERAAALQEECDVRNSVLDSVSRVKQLEELLRGTYEVLKDAKLFMTDVVVVESTIENKIEQIVRSSLRDADFSECVTSQGDVDCQEQAIVEAMTGIEELGIIEDEDEDDE